MRSFKKTRAEAWACLFEKSFLIQSPGKSVLMTLPFMRPMSVFHCRLESNIIYVHFIDASGKVRILCKNSLYSL